MSFNRNLLWICISLSFLGSGANARIHPVPVGAVTPYVWTDADVATIRTVLQGAFVPSLQQLVVNLDQPTDPTTLGPYLKLYGQNINLMDPVTRESSGYFDSIDISGNSVLLQQKDHSFFLAIDLDSTHFNRISLMFNAALTLPADHPVPIADISPLIDTRVTITAGAQQVWQKGN